MKERTLTGAMIFLTIVFALLVRTFSIYIFDVLVLALMVGASIESSRLFANMGLFNHKRIVLIFPILLYAAFLLIISAKISLLWAIIILLGLIILMAALSFLFSFIFKNKTTNEIKTRKSKQSLSGFALSKAVHTLIACVYPALGLLGIIALNHLHIILPTSATQPEYLSLAAVLFMLIITTITDTFSMLVGKAFGKRRLAPKISPNKTIAGFVGGIVFAILFALATFALLDAFEGFNLLFYATSLNHFKVAVLAFFAALACNVGDLFESYLKRKANVKDSGNFLPGHGGLLDRFDSHSLSALVVLLFFVILI